MEFMAQYLTNKMGLTFWMTKNAVKSMDYSKFIGLGLKLQLKTENGIIDAPMWGLWYMRLTGQLSIANYYRLNNSRSVFTMETPTSLLWENRLKMQKTAVTMLLYLMMDDK